MERRVKMGLVGGGFGCAFQFGVHPGCKVVAVADLRPDRREALRNYYRCDTVYHTLEELLRDPNMEAVGLFTPAPLHARHSIAALKAGKHVLSAVPAAFKLEECQLLPPRDQPGAKLVSGGTLRRVVLLRGRVLARGPGFPDVP